MPRTMFGTLRRMMMAALGAAALLAWAPSTDARVTRIIIDQTADTAGDATYQTMIGRAFGELDPSDPHNTIITDIALAPRNADGKVEYIASFALVMPKDPSRISGLMWHDVPNRGGRLILTGDLRAQGDVGLSSGWQGDNAGATVVPATAATLAPVTPSTNEWVKTPVVSGLTGRILARIVNRSGTNQPLNVMGNAIPYFPADSANNADAFLKVHLAETITGVVTEGETIPNTDWKFCYGAGATFAAPGLPTALPVRVCLNGAARTFD